MPFYVFLFNPGIEEVDSNVSWCHFIVELHGSVDDHMTGISSKDVAKSQQVHQMFYWFLVII
jgi:hypothetical protein